MSSTARRLICGSWLVLAAGPACAVDLLVGGAETSTGVGSETQSAETVSIEPPGTTEAADSSSGSTPITETTGDPPGDTSTSTGEESTTTGTMEESSTGEIPCKGQNGDVCNELEYCLWYPDTEDCVPSPCVDLMHECLELPFDVCNEAPSCAWQKLPEGCHPIECVPCELLDEPQCLEVPTCDWTELEMVCDPAPV